MDRYHTVKKNSDFANAIHTGKYAKNSCYSIYIVDNGLDRYRFGISVSKKLGNSVHRNLYKRQLRFIIDKNKKNYQNGKDYIIIIRKDYVDLDFSSKDELFMKLICKLNDFVAKEK